MKYLKLLLLSMLMFGCAQEKKPPDTNKLKPSNTTAREGTADCTYFFNHSRLCLSYSWVKAPTDTELGTFTFKTYRQNVLDQTPIQVDLGSIPDVILWMPSMGHGSSPVTVEKVDTGTYRATRVFFIMPGEWQIKWQVKQGSTVEDELIVPITI